MNPLKEILERYPDAEFMIADGFNEAILGVGEQAGMPFKLVYSAQKCIDILVQRDNMTQEEAEEFFHYNVAGSFVGSQTPIWLMDI